MDIWKIIFFKNLNEEDCLKCRLVCKKWNKVIINSRKKRVDFIFKEFEDYGVKYVTNHSHKFWLWTIKPPSDQKIITKNMCYISNALYDLLDNRWQQRITLFLYHEGLKLYVQYIALPLQLRFDQICKIILDNLKITKINIIMQLRAISTDYCLFTKSDILYLTKIRKSVEDQVVLTFLSIFAK